MTLVERFIEIDGWPVSRKTALLNGLGLPIILICWLIMHVAGANSHVVNIVWLDRLLGCYVLAQLVCLVISVIAARAGDESLWTARVLLLLIGPFIFGLIYGLGIWTTALFAMYPIAVILSALWFPARIAWGAFLAGLFAIAAISWLEGAGVLPHAPLLLDRSIDAQQAAGWVVGMAGLMMGFFAFCFLLCLAIIAARRLQDRRLQQAQQLIRRYVPSQLADKIIRGEHSETFKPERAKLTVFFSDVEGFTEASDHLDPEDLASLLNEYLAEMMAIAERCGATINQIVGDGIMAFFGAPQATNDKDHALRAVHMALEMQKRMAELKDVWVNRGIQKPFRIRIGINTGHASVGDYGSPGRKLYSAIGVQTNLAARIQTHCEAGKVLISHSTWALVHDEIACADKGELQLKGVHYLVKVYEVT